MLWTSDSGREREFLIDSTATEKPRRLVGLGAAQGRSEVSAIRSDRAVIFGRSRIFHVSFLRLGIVTGSLMTLVERVV